MHLETMTHEEVGALDLTGAVVLIPVGSIEQHGPHLPLDTDSFLCAAIASAAAARAQSAGPVVVTPTLSFGVAQHHMAFPGTLTLKPETFRRAVEDLCHSLFSHGLSRQIIVNGHGGNRAPLSEIVQQLGFEPAIQIGTVSYWMLAREVVDEVRESPRGGMGHACELETSLMLYLRPESVRRELIRREIATPRYSIEDLDMFGSSALTAHWRTDELSQSGVLGAPDLATAEKGGQIFEACVAGLARLVDEFRAR